MLKSFLRLSEKPHPTITIPFYHAGCESIYIYKEECLSVRYAFGHGTSKCNEILHGIPFRPEEGHRVVFDPKFSTQGVFGPPLY